MHLLEFAGEDDAFAAREAGSVAADVEVVAPGVAVARGLDVDRVSTLAYTRTACDLVGRTDADPASAGKLLEAASLDRDGSVAVRARDVRGLTAVSTADLERDLGEVLVDRGFAVDLEDPDHTLRVLVSEGVCGVGWVVAESDRTFAERRPTDRPFFQPGSMAPMDARAIVNIAGAGPDATLLDPMCGTGGLLIEAGLVGARPVGVDAQGKMTRGSRENLAAYVPGRGDVLRGDASDLPFRDGVVDAVAFDAPYGRQSKIARHERRDLLAGALAEGARVASDDARAVLVADRDWSEAAGDAGWTVTDRLDRRVHRSLIRHVHVLE